MKYVHLVAGFLICTSCLSQINIDTNFAGSNVIIDSIAVDTLYFRPDLRTTQSEWFYWNFRAVANTPKRWYFKANRKNVLTALGASFSLDGGDTWQWVDKMDNLGPNMFSYSFEADDSTVRFSLGQPYTEKNYRRFIKAYENHPNIKLSVLATTRKGREVERITIGNFNTRPKLKILLTARHHACEMMASYVLEGMIASLLDGSKEMEALLKKAEITIIPFVDKDGVEEGDQGKNRWPRDHNRDYSGNSIYASTAAIRNLKTEWIGNDPWIAIDLHNPWVLGSGAQRIHFVGKEPAAFEKEQRKFAEILTDSQRGELKVDGKNNFLAWGESWNVGSNDSQGWSLVAWAGSYFKQGTLMATTVEFPYALNGDQVITAKNAREFGRDLTYALKLYLDEQ
ncbi:MAG: M14 family zinc carboxypeptidase [Sediminicola sp.]